MGSRQNQYTHQSPSLPCSAVVGPGTRPAKGIIFINIMTTRKGVYTLNGAESLNGWIGMQQITTDQNLIISWILISVRVSIYILCIYINKKLPANNNLANLYVTKYNWASFIYEYSLLL